MISVVPVYNVEKISYKGFIERLKQNEILLKRKL